MNIIINNNTINNNTNKYNIERKFRQKLMKLKNERERDERKSKLFLLSGPKKNQATHKYAGAFGSNRT